MLLTMCCQKRLCQRRRVSLCMLVRAHRRAEGERFMLILGNLASF